MAGKALESFPAASYPLSTYPSDRGAKSSITSEQVASSLSGYPSGVQHDRPLALQGCSAVYGEGEAEPNMVPYPRLFFTLRRSRGATGRYQGPNRGAIYGAPTVPTTTGGGDAMSRGGKGVKHKDKV